MLLDDDKDNNDNDDSGDDARPFIVDTGTDTVKSGRIDTDTKLDRPNKIRE